MICKVLYKCIAIGIHAADRTYDYIHQRFFLPAITVDTLNTVLRSCYRCLQFDGQYEIFETDHRILYAGTFGENINSWLEEFFERRKCPLFHMVPNMKSILESNGFTDCKSYTYDVPLGGWAGRTGLLGAKDYFDWLLALRPIFGKLYPNIDQMEYERVLRGWEKEVWEHKSCVRMYVYVCRRPSQ